MGKSGGGVPSETSTKPWSEQEPYLKDIMRQAEIMYGKPIYETETETIAPTVKTTKLNRSGKTYVKEQPEPVTITKQVLVGREPGTAELSYYSGDTVAGFTPEQTEAQNLIEARARAGSPLLQSAQAQAQNIGEGSYLDRDVDLSNLRNTLEGGFLDRSPDSGYLEGTIGGDYLSRLPDSGFLKDTLSGESLGRSPDLDYLIKTLKGDYLAPESNPYLGQYVSDAFEQTLPQLDTSAIAAGRYGSDAWGAMKGRTMADITSDIYGQAYETERGRQAQAQQLATGLLEDAYQQERGRQYGGEQLMANLAEQAYQQERGRQYGGEQLMTDLSEQAYQQERARQAAAEQYATGIQEDAYQQESARMMQALGMAPELARADYDDYAQLAAVGAERQAMEQALIDAEREKFEWEQRQPWEQLGMYSDMIQGNYGGTATSTGGGK